MIQQFEVENILGQIYSQGNIQFSKNKNILFSPVANRVKVINLENNTSSILPFESRSDVALITISNDSKVMIIVDVGGYALIVNLISQQIISHFNFKGRVKNAEFSPDGKFLCITTGISIRIYEAPSIFRSFESLILYKKLAASHAADIQSVCWSPDSRFLATSSKDLTVQLHNVFTLPAYKKITFSANKEVVKKMFFSDDMQYFYTLDNNSVMCIWKWTSDFVSQEYKNMQNHSSKFRGQSAQKKIKLNNKDDINIQEDGEQEEVSEVDQVEQSLYSDFEKQISTGNYRFILVQKHKFYQKQFSKLKSVQYHSGIQLLILGYKHSNFTLHKIMSEEVHDIQDISISEHKISTISINQSGSWIGFGLKESGQLMVWEWRSQSYILNQQSMGVDVSCSDFSRDSKVIATGGFDGKIRLWDSNSYLCFSTIEGHTSKITGLTFSTKAKTLLSCSLDGTAKAYDLNKYRCFRTLKTDESAQLSCIAIDPAGEIVCAGATDPYNIYCWNLQTGNLLEAISGHQASITCLQFSLQESMLVSGSLDKTVRIHDIFSRKTNTDVLDHNSEITDLAIRNDGKELCVSTLKGELYVWDAKQANIKANIDCRRDLGGGRLQNERQTSQTSSRNKHFRSIEYSSDGEYILAGGNAKTVCLYDIKHRLMVKKFEFTSNRSLDGVLTKLNTKNLVEGIVREEHEVDTESDYEDRKDDSLPGAKKIGNKLSKRNTKLAVECLQIKLSPTCDSFTIVTSEGLFVYGKNKQKIFTPLELESHITLESVQTAMENQNFSQALSMALKMNNNKLLQQVYLNIPQKFIFACVKKLEQKYIETFLVFISNLVTENHSVELHLLWLENLLFEYSDYFRQLDIHSISNLKGLLKKLSFRFEDVNTVSQQNIYTIDFLTANMKLAQKKQNQIMEQEIDQEI